MVATDPIGHAALKKTSWRLLPLLFLGYGIAYIDRLNISFAALQMNEDLHFSATVYGLGGGLFFLSYALCEVPSNLLLIRFGARRWIARIMLTWGVIAIGMMFIRTPTQFYVMRFLLGMAEAGFFPGVLFYLTQWFPAAHRGRAISRFYFAFPISVAVSGALAGPLLALNGHLGLAGWQWLFLVEGIPAVVLGAVVLAWLPNHPSQAAWLNPQERQWIQNAVSAEAAALDTARHDGVLRALLNRGFWLLALCNVCILVRATRWSVGSNRASKHRSLERGGSRSLHVSDGTARRPLHGVQRSSLGSSSRAISACDHSAEHRRLRIPGDGTLEDTVDCACRLCCLLHRLHRRTSSVLADSQRQSARPLRRRGIRCARLDWHARRIRGPFRLGLVERS